MTAESNARFEEVDGLPVLILSSSAPTKAYRDAVLFRRARAAEGRPLPAQVWIGFLHEEVLIDLDGLETVRALSLARLETLGFVGYTLATAALARSAGLPRIEALVSSSASQPIILAIAEVAPVTPAAPVTVGQEEDLEAGSEVEAWALPRPAATVVAPIETVAPAVASSATETNSAGVIATPAPAAITAPTPTGTIIEVAAPATETNTADDAVAPSPETIIEASATETTIETSAPETDRVDATETTVEAAATASNETAAIASPLPCVACLTAIQDSDALAPAAYEADPVSANDDIAQMSRNADISATAGVSVSPAPASSPDAFVCFSPSAPTTDVPAVVFQPLSPAAHVPVAIADAPAPVAFPPSTQWTLSELDLPSTEDQAEQIAQAIATDIAPRPAASLELVLIEDDRAPAAEIEEAVAPTPLVEEEAIVGDVPPLVEVAPVVQENATETAAFVAPEASEAVVADVETDVEVASAAIETPVVVAVVEAATEEPAAEEPAAAAVVETATDVATAVESLPVIEASTPEVEAPAPAAESQPAVEAVASVEEEPSEVAPQPYAQRTVCVISRVHSGQVVEALNDVVLSRLVGNGGEILAGGSIHAYGPLLGRAMAGAYGDATARIYASDFRAEMVSIAGRFRVFEEVPPELFGRPVEIWLDGEVLRFALMGEFG